MLDQNSLSQDNPLFIFAVACFSLLRSALCSSDFDRSLYFFFFFKNCVNVV